MVVQTTPPTGGMVQTLVIGECPDHATYREKGAISSLVRQTWAF